MPSLHTSTYVTFIEKPVCHTFISHNKFVSDKSPTQSLALLYEEAKMGHITSCDIKEAFFNSIVLNAFFLTRLIMVS